MVGIVGSDKCNAIAIASLKFWLKYFCKTVIYDMLWIFSIKYMVLLVPLIGFLYYSLLY